MRICVVSRWRGRTFWKARKEISSTETDLIFLCSGLYIKKIINFMRNKGNHIPYQYDMRSANALPV